MRLFLFFLVVLGPSLLLAQDNTCSDSVTSFPLVDTTTNCEGFSSGNSYTYPDDFTYTNDVTWYQCPDSGVRIVISNNIPDHDVSVNNPHDLCETPYWITLPLEPELASDKLEPSNLGIIAIALNGVSIYGAQEAGGTNAVEPESGAMIQDAQYWFGHPDGGHRWHYHNPQMGHETVPDENTLMAYALDGFPIYGPLSDSDVGELDECNGRMVDGKYRYHIRTLDQVEGGGDYCDGDSAAIQWDYVIGCWSGSIADTAVATSGTGDIPSDCVVYDPSDVEEESESDSESGIDSEGDSESDSENEKDSESGSDAMDDGDFDEDSEDTSGSGAMRPIGYLMILLCIFFFF